MGKKLTGNPGKQADELEHERRIAEVFDRLVIGFGRTRIVDFCCKTWGVSSRTADTYIAIAKKKALPQFNASLERRRARALARHEALIIRLLSTGEAKLALKLIMWSERFQGLGYDQREGVEQANPQIDPSKFVIVLPDHPKPPQPEIEEELEDDE
jgi:hypothetical protein